MDEELRNEVQDIYLKWHDKHRPVSGFLKEIMALIASYSRELQIDDREVLIGMFEANKDNISVGEIIATLKGQVEAIEAEPEGKPNE